MKFSIGDRMVLNRTGEEGYVTAFIDNQMIEVEVGGVVFPVHIADIDHPYLRWFTDKTKKKKTTLPEQFPAEKVADRKQRLAKGVYLSFLPVFKTQEMEEVVDVLKVHLLNEMPIPVKFSYDVRIAQNSEFRHEGTLHAFGNLYLHSVDYAVMNDQPRFHWKLADVENTNLAPAEGILRIKPAKLFEHINDIQVKGEPTFSYMLIEDFIAKKKDDPASRYAPPPPPPAPAAKLVSAKTMEAPKFEVDLHIEALMDNRKGLSNADIVSIQLEALRHHLQLCIVHRQERMIVIHGLGKGRLKEEVHTILKQTPEVNRYKNEWSAKYGFGATEIFFRY